MSDLAHRRELYCCDNTFEAVTAESAPVKLAQKPGIGWTVDGKAAQLKFCPWCGEALPEEGFTGEFRLAEIADARTDTFAAQP